MSIGGTITRREALRRAALLLGGAISAPTVAAVLAGCDRRSAGVARRPATLTAEQDELVAAIAEHIIPATDTPGARAAGVNEFVDVILTEYYPAEQRSRFLDGLADVDARARTAHGRPFLRCTAAEQAAILVALDEESFAPRRRARTAEETEAYDAVRERTEGAAINPLPAELEREWVRAGSEPLPARKAPAFFATMKELTVVGYYTSEIGATQELRYLAVPGPYRGCIPFTEARRTWAV